MSAQSSALHLAAYWSAKNDQGEYLYSSLDFREDTAAELRRLVAQRDALLEALQALCDEQEGPPLIRRQRQWQAALDKARAAIAVVEGETK